jgi:glycosyltransferase 2 family protein
VIQTKNIIIIIAKIVISVTLLYYIITKIGFSNIISSVKQANLFLLCITAGLYFLILFCTALRLKLLLPVPLTLKTLFSLSAIGSFFNMYVPSGVGGDIVKLYYLTRKQEQSTHEISAVTALTVIVLEKYLGLGSIFMMGIVAYPFNIRYINEQLRWIWIFPVGFTLFFIFTGFLLYFRIGMRKKFLSGFYDCVDYYRRRKIVMFKAFLYSLAILTITVVYMYSIARGLNLDIPLLYLFFITPVIHLVMMFPLTFAGLGVREGAFVILLKAVGVSPSFAVSLSLISFLATAPGNLYGLIEYLRYKHTVGKTG